MAIIGSSTDQGIHTDAHTGKAHVELRARVAVITGGTVRLVWIRALTRDRIAHPDAVALIHGGAHHSIFTGTHTGHAHVTLGAEAVVVARGPILTRWIGATARGRITDACLVTLVGGRAHHGITGNADSSLTGVGPGAEITVGAARAIAAAPVLACADAKNLTLVSADRSSYSANSCGM